MKQVAISMEELVPLLQLQMETAGAAVLTVTGWSMLPMLHNRKDQVTIAPVTDRCKQGDVILYRRENGRYVLHRILRCRKDGYILCGDNQFFTEKVNHSQVIAVVTAFTRKGKNYLVTDAKYRRYTWFWVVFHPIRWIYLIPRRLLGYIRTFFRHLKKR